MRGGQSDPLAGSDTADKKGRRWGGTNNTNGLITSSTDVKRYYNILYANGFVRCCSALHTDASLKGTRPPEPSKRSVVVRLTGHERSCTMHSCVYCVWVYVCGCVIDCNGKKINIIIEFRSTSSRELAVEQTHCSRLCADGRTRSTVYFTTRVYYNIISLISAPTVHQTIRGRRRCCDRRNAIWSGMFIVLRIIWWYTDDKPFLCIGTR